jgi:hypothetical protein
VCWLLIGLFDDVLSTADVDLQDGMIWKCGHEL